MVKNVHFNLGMDFSSYGRFSREASEIFNFRRNPQFHSLKEKKKKSFLEKILKLVKLSPKRNEKKDVHYI
jgi:hypothetical protein